MKKSSMRLAVTTVVLAIALTLAGYGHASADSGNLKQTTKYIERVLRGITWE